MKSDLSHLPLQKAGLQRAGIGERAVGARGVEKVRAQPGVDAEMIILFGSYARGDWVEGPGT